MLKHPHNLSIVVILSNIQELSVILESLIHIGEITTEVYELLDIIIEWMNKVKVSLYFFSWDNFNKFKVVELFWLHI